MKKIIYLLSLFVLFTCSTVKAQQYNTHRVVSGETVTSIAEKYNVSVSDIFKLNPDSQTGLKLGAVLIIPKTSQVVSTSKPISEKEEVVNKIFQHYIKHKTRRKETLFSISQKYNIEIEDIKRHNKFLYANNLRKGDKLQIPIYKKVISYVEKAPEVVVENATYTVQPKEGKWRIAYKYGITVQELETLNPNMVNVLQPGQIINVPNIEKHKVKTVEANYSYYTVLPKEGFYRLKVKLGLEQIDLERLNPELVKTGLKEGMILKVPLENNNVVVTENNSLQENVVNNASEVVNLSNKITDFSVKNIAVMLPFTLNKINTDSISDTKKQIKNNRTLSISLDFYSGALMAFDFLKALGINLKVDVYDTQNRLSQVNSIIRNNNFYNTHAVIGPLLTNNFNTAASSLKSNNVPVISPIVNKVKVGRNVFQSRPSDAILKNKIINYFKADSTAQIVIISDVKRKAISSMLSTKFSKAKQVSSRLDKKTSKDAYYVLEQDLINVIKPGNNVVFLETDNAGFVSNVSSVLNGLQNKKTKITLTTTNKNKAFDSDEISNYHLSNLHFTYPSISKMLNSETSNSFVKKYKEQYAISPNTYAIRGFDLTMDVVLRLVTSQDLYSSVNQSPKTEYLENSFTYKKSSYGGYINESVYLVQYNDLKIEEIKQ